MSVFALLNRLTHSIIDGDAEQAEKLTRRCLAESVSPAEVLGAGLVPGMDVVLHRLRNEERNIDDLLRATQAMEAALKILRPKPSRPAAAGSPLLRGDAGACFLLRPGGRCPE